MKIKRTFIYESMTTHRVPAFVLRCILAWDMATCPHGYWDIGYTGHRTYDDDDVTNITNHSRQPKVGKVK